MNRLRVLVYLFVAAFTFADEMVPFVIPVDIHPDSEIAMSYKPLTETDRLTATRYFRTVKGHRVRLWGVNLSFSANFPTHKDAGRIAKRMAAFGVNSVRFHHMDTARWPRGIWDSPGHDLHPEALDRLDYFIDQLAQHGIYSNINLHVGAEHSKSLALPAATRNYDKVITLFTPKLIDAQKDYARKLLTHKNKYRDNVTYADDYAVAIVEITNENSFFMWDGEKTLRNLPPYYANILQTQYNLWLKNKYTTTEQLKEAWGKDVEPMGEKNLLQNAIPETGWHLEQHGEGKAIIPPQKRSEYISLKIQIDKVDGTGWHLQYNHRDLPFEQGRYYSVTFKARAAAERNLSVSVGQAHEPWANLGLSRTVTLTPQWQTFTLGFAATQSDDNGRLNFAFGDSNIDIELGIVELRTGGQIVLGPDESIEQANVALFAEREAKARVTDRMVFLAETEKTYFDNMRQYIKDDLGTKSMVTGTIVFGPLGLYAQSDMDFIDAHTYWQHPHFPNKPWDPGDWTINQKAMTNDSTTSTLAKLAPQRLSGKPFTVSEYNHPAPLDSQAECVPMIASFAARQNWDGVWLYTYSHSNENWDRRHLAGYFDIDSNPAKWGFMPAGSEIFRNDRLDSEGIWFKQTIGLSGLRRPYLEALADSTLDYQKHLKKSPIIKAVNNLYNTLIETKLRAKSSLAPCNFRGNRSRSHPFYTSGVEWSDRNRLIPTNKSDLSPQQREGLKALKETHGYLLIRSPYIYVLTGNLKDMPRLNSLFSMNVEIDSPGHTTIVMQSTDNKPIHKSHSVLITACGRCENTDMIFSENRRTVGKNWGNGPVCIEAVRGSISQVPLFGDTTAIQMTCKILNPDGTVKTQYDVTNNRILLDPEFGTMWYLIERK